MTATCEACREKPASVRDFALRSGRWVQAEVCDDCARKRRRAPLTILGIAAGAAALFGGAALAIDAVGRRNNPSGESAPAPQALSDLGRVFRGSSTLGQYSRDLTEAAK